MEERLQQVARNSLAAGAGGALWGAVLATYRGQSVSFYATGMGLNYAFASGVFLGTEMAIRAVRDQRDAVGFATAGCITGVVLAGPFGGPRQGAIAAVALGGLGYVGYHVHGRFESYLQSLAEERRRELEKNQAASGSGCEQAMTPDEPSEQQPSALGTPPASPARAGSSASLRLYGTAKEENVAVDSLLALSSPFKSPIRPKHAHSTPGGVARNGGGGGGPSTDLTPVSKMLRGSSVQSPMPVQSPLPFLSSAPFSPYSIPQLHLLSPNATLDIAAAASPAVPWQAMTPDKAEARKRSKHLFSETRSPEAVTWALGMPGVTHGRMRPPQSPARQPRAPSVSAAATATRTSNDASEGLADVSAAAGLLGTLAGVRSPAGGVSSHSPSPAKLSAQLFMGTLQNNKGYKNIHELNSRWGGGARGGGSRDDVPGPAAGGGEEGSRGAKPATAGEWEGAAVPAAVVDRRARSPADGRAKAQAVGRFGSAAFAPTPSPSATKRPSTWNSGGGTTPNGSRCRGSFTIEGSTFIPKTPGSSQRPGSASRRLGSAGRERAAPSAGKGAAGSARSLHAKAAAASPAKTPAPTTPTRAAAPAPMPPALALSPCPPLSPPLGLSPGLGMSPMHGLALYPSHMLSPGAAILPPGSPAGRGGVLRRGSPVVVGASGTAAAAYASLGGEGRMSPAGQSPSAQGPRGVVGKKQSLWSPEAGAAVAAAAAMTPGPGDNSPAARARGGAVPETPRGVTCNCKRSRCLKLYCECFQRRQYCKDCNCKECMNVLATEGDRQAAIRATIERNPNAFTKKFDKSTGKRLHNGGCNCKKTFCLKKYCECFQGGASCGDKCKCTNCKNFEGSSVRKRRLSELGETAPVVPPAAAAVAAAAVPIASTPPMWTVQSASTPQAPTRVAPGQGESSSRGLGGGEGGAGTRAGPAAGVAASSSTATAAARVGGTVADTAGSRDHAVARSLLNMGYAPIEAEVQADDRGFKLSLPGGDKANNDGGRGGGGGGRAGGGGGGGGGARDTGQGGGGGRVEDGKCTQLPGIAGAAKVVKVASPAFLARPASASSDESGGCSSLGSPGLYGGGRPPSAAAASPSSRAPGHRTPKLTGKDTFLRPFGRRNLVKKSSFVRVMGFLDDGDVHSCSLVSKTWSKLAWDETLWER